METCQHCQEQINKDTEVWVDNSGGDVCGWNGGNEPHEPTPDTCDCEGCGKEIGFVYDKDERHCESCVAEYEQELRDREWDYWHA